MYHSCCRKDLRGCGQHTKQTKIFLAKTALAGAALSGAQPRWRLLCLRRRGEGENLCSPSLLNRGVCLLAPARAAPASAAPTLALSSSPCNRHHCRAVAAIIAAAAAAAVATTAMQLQPSQPLQPPSLRSCSSPKCHHHRAVAAITAAVVAAAVAVTAHLQLSPPPPSPCSCSHCRSCSRRSCHCCCIGISTIIHSM